MRAENAEAMLTLRIVAAEALYSRARAIDAAAAAASSVLESSQEYPQRLDWARTFVSDYEAITLDEIKALAKEYLGGHEGLGVIIKPKVSAAETK